MSLKLRLFVLVGALLAAMLTAEALLVRGLAGDLAHGIDVVALGVSESLLTSLEMRHALPDAETALASSGAGAPRAAVLHVAVAPDADRGGVLHVVGPGLEKRIPIPDSGVDDAIASFMRRLALGSCALLAVGLVASAALV